MFNDPYLPKENVLIKYCGILIKLMFYSICGKQLKQEIIPPQQLLEGHLQQAVLVRGVLACIACPAMLEGNHYPY